MLEQQTEKLVRFEVGGLLAAKVEDLLTLPDNEIYIDIRLLTLQLRLIGIRSNN